MAIRYLDGRRLSRAVIAGSRFVADRAEPLNKINVFPVPDGDTGTNVASTLQQISAGISRVRQRHIREMSRALAEEAVGGARGNSGAILAQFFCGFSEGLPDSPRISAGDFGAAVVRASDSAYGAIARPVEGTILTVIRDWSAYVARRARDVADFAQLLPDSLAEAKKSLENTPKQMKALAKAGVVDAGGQAFVYLIEGIVRYLREAARGGIVEAPAEEVKAAIFDKTSESILFRYCTEVLLEGDRIDRDALRREAALLGDSIVVAGGATRVRLHVHTNEPERLFELMARLGEVAQTKIEDMHAQHETRFDQNRASRVGVVTDSTCDLPPTLVEELAIGVVPVRVYFGSENYLDKVTIMPSEFYARFSVTDVAPKTSQPPPADFTQVFQNVATHSGALVSVNLSAAVSGTHQAAIVGGRAVKNATIEHIDSRNVSVGLGLIVRAAAEAAAAGKSAAEVAAVARDAVDRTRLFIAVPTLEHLVRGGRVSPVRGFIGKLLGLLPVLTITPEGKAEPAAKARGFAAARARMMKLLFEAADLGTSARRFGVAHCDAPSLADAIAREIRERYPESDVMIVECGPALGAHGGPGALAVAVLP
ncbi:MAG: DegV family EDD domain-containing protein [Acidobacteria bacterium]|nr:DegV family EDD domain-containing protein [Acidobacteriota bacterium]MCA1610217.1 DegV family EDD domain-containing protein [Acidobacteriota bacterium]